ncbi:HIT domain-containing protein [bacterium]|nr:HIT domain-containing protein [bacterium]
MTNPKLDIDNARYPDQIATMKQSLANHESPFLPENLAKYHKLPIIKKGKYWYVTANQWPYQHTKVHFLIIANQYWTKLTDITPEASAEVITLAQWLQKKYHVPGGALCIRFGNSDYSGATIDHLHWQYIVPDIEDPDYDRVRFTVGKKPSKLTHSAS